MKLRILAAVTWLVGITNNTESSASGTRFFLLIGFSSPWVAVAQAPTGSSLRSRFSWKFTLTRRGFKRKYDMIRAKRSRALYGTIRWLI